MGTARCNHCGVAPGQAHRPGCDIERCRRCGLQRLMCFCEDSVPHTIWTGEFPGRVEARARGWWARYTADGWQPCPPDAPGATPDLNRLAYYNALGFDGNYSAEELSAGLEAEEPDAGLDRDGVEY